MDARDHTGWKFFAAFAAAKLLLQLAFISGYGWFRDEFYYLACSHHLDFGYVDHPPLSILLLTIWRTVAGDSLVAVRMLPAVAGALTVAVVGLTAREFGGGRWAQALAMITTIAAPFYLAVHHFYSMNALDVLVWAVAAWVLARICRMPEPKLWIVLGLVLGLGLQNKISVLWLGLGMAVGLLLTSHRRHLATRWPWLGAALAVLAFAPHLLWQMAHDWPTLEFMSNAMGSKMEHKSALKFVAEQGTMMGVLNIAVWAAGLVFLFDGRGGQFRPLGWTYVTILALLAFSGTARSGYLGPAYTWLFAAGAVVLTERWRRWATYVLAGVLVIWGGMVAPLALPILPVERYVDYARAFGEEASTEERKEVGVLKQFYADMHGWDRIVDAVEEACATLTPQEREQAVVYASNYGVAGAVDRLGRERGLPPAVSGHNNYWFWGTRGRSADVVVAVGGSAADHELSWQSVERITETDCGYCMPYENGNGVFVLRGRRRPVEQIWPAVRHYD